MRESLVNLLKLQEIDKEINALHQSQTDYPKEINSLKGELQDARDQLDAQQQRSEELEKDRRALERELGAIEEDLKKHQDRLYEVKTNKEYDALQIEIATLNDRKDQHETAILESIDTVEKIVEKLREDENYYREIEDDRQKRIDELTVKLNSVEKDVGAWQKKRSAIEPGVERRPLSIYNSIRKVVKGGIAIVPIRKGSCGGCYRQLSPQRLVEVRRADSIMRCESCGRLLVWSDEEAAV